MKIVRSGTQKSAEVPSQCFTGTVGLDPVFKADPPARAKGNYVTFEAGARTNWHTHPLGQTIIITHGCGRVQCESGPVETVTVGDVVWFPPWEKHWHGASPEAAMTHLAIGESLDGKSADWLEAVSDDEYTR